MSMICVVCDHNKEILDKQESEILSLQKIMNEILEKLQKHEIYKIDYIDKKILDLNNLRSEVEFEINRVFKRLDFTSDKSNELDKRLLELEESVKHNSIGLEKCFFYIEEKIKEIKDELKRNEDGIIKCFVQIESNRSHIKRLENNKKENEQSSLCSTAFNNEKKTGLSFEEAITEFKNGKIIKRKQWINCWSICLNDLNKQVNFLRNINIKDILENDWEIVD